MESERKIIITIPTRSGSKRLPRKNTLPIAGKPMFYYSVRAAKEAKITDYIYVLSDDEDTLKQAQEFGAIPFKLHSEMAGDTTGVVKASLYAINKLREKENLKFDDLICLQPSSPLRIAEDICNSYQKFLETKANTLVSVAKVDPHYFHWAMKKLENQNFGEMYFKEKFLKPRQELPEICWPTGAIKITKIDFLERQKNFFGEKTAIYEMPKRRSIHVATQFEFNLCKILIENGI